jgi:PTH1 family peptidyl-tRNA hydrolase
MPVKLIVGLGNPGREYEATRHNAGFWLLERFAAARRIELRAERRHFGRVAACEGAWLLEPSTYMNESGKSVLALAAFYKIPPAEILVLHDEIDFPPGTVKMKLGGGVAGHNGLKSIAARLGSQDFWRVRLGVGHPGDKHLVADYVLKKPLKAEREAIEAALERALEVLPICLEGDMQAAMLKLHTRKGGSDATPSPPSVPPPPAAKAAR